MADIPIPPIPPRRAPLIDIMRELEVRPRQRQSQEFDPVAAMAAERRSQSRQPLPLPPIPPAVAPPRTAGDSAEAGPPRDLSSVSPTIRDRLPENNPYVAAAIDIAEKYNLPRDVFLSLVHQESRFDPKAKSPRGAFGLTQLMPGTARDLGVDPRDPMANLDAGARYLRQQIDRFGSLPLALAAYNSGPGRVIKSGNQIPNIRETQNYVSDILRNAGMEGTVTDQRYGFAEGGRVRESLVDMEDRYADAPTIRSADEEYDRRLLERDPYAAPVSRLGVAGVPVPRGGRDMYPGNTVSPFEAAASLVPTMEGVQRGMMSAMAGVDIPEGARVVQTDMTRSGYAIETADGRLIDPEGRQGRDVREFAGTTRRSAVLPVSQDVETGEASLDVPALLDMLPMAGVQGGPAGALGAGRTRRPRGGDMLEPTQAWHATSKPFEEYDWTRLGQETYNNVSGMSTEERALNLAKLGPWAHEQKLGGRMGVNVNLPVEVSGKTMDFKSLDDLERRIRRAGGATNFREELIAKGYGNIRVLDEEFGGTSYVGLTPESWRIVQPEVLAGVEGGPAGALGVGRTRRPRVAEVPEPIAENPRAVMGDNNPPRVIAAVGEAREGKPAGGGLREAIPVPEVEYAAPDRSPGTVIRHNPARGESARFGDFQRRIDAEPQLLSDIMTTAREGEDVGRQWYNTEATRQRFIDLLGDKEGNDAWVEFMYRIGAASPGNAVYPNIRQASYYFTEPAEARAARKAEFEATGKYPRPPEPYGSLTQQYQAVLNDLVDRGEFIGNVEPTRAPKPRGFANSLLGNPENIAADKHFMRFIGMASGDPRFLHGSAVISQELAGEIAERFPEIARDNITRRKVKDATGKEVMQTSFNAARAVRQAGGAEGDLFSFIKNRPTVWDEVPRDNEYGAYERLALDIANRMNMTPAQLQASLWMGAARRTGVRESSLDTFDNIFNRVVQDRAAERGLDPAEVFRLFVNRMQPLAVPGAVGAGAAVEGSRE